METLYYKLGDNPSLSQANKICYALGFFDGVHVGHRELISECISCARRKGMRPAVFTFSSESGSIKTDTPRLYSTESKLRILESLGVELAVVCDFVSVKDLSPADFVDRVLIDALGCGCALFGDNFRFGRRAEGDAQMLFSLLEERGLSGIRLPLKSSVDGKVISASEIRSMLSIGDIQGANDYLGSPYFVSGEVEHGLGKGRLFGFPTVNTPLPTNTPLCRGVYKTEVKIGERAYTGLTNVGVCPTVGDREVHAETTIIGYDGDLYGQRVDICFLEFIREERRFSSVDDLKAQIQKDYDYVTKGISK